jgi:tetraacyldisaccharide 4'-kinase
MRAAIERALTSVWYRPGPPPWALRPLSGLYALLAGLVALPWRLGWRRPWQARCPVVVVGNLVAGGAGKTPTVIALVQALQAAGRRPGVVSRGHGRRSRGTVLATAVHDAGTLGDEPWLIRRRTGVPLAVGARRADAAARLLQAHPDIDVLVADDGLQHRGLARDLELWVFDERGVGNGALLPSGPLRQPLPDQLPPQVLVLYNAPVASTGLPGDVARRRLAGAVPLRAWHAGQPMLPEALSALRGRPLLAVAGIAAPQRFFGMLSDAGLSCRALALPDHADLSTPPWPAATPEVVCTEKDAAKLHPDAVGRTRVWVIGLDFRLPPGLTAQVLDRLPSR